MSFLKKLMRNHIILGIVFLISISLISFPNSEQKEFPETFSGMISFDVDSIIPNTPVTITLSDNDLNRDPTKIEKITIDTAYQPIPIDFIVDDLSATNYQLGSTPVITINDFSPSFLVTNSQIKISGIEVSPYYAYSGGEGEVMFTTNDLQIETSDSWRFEDVTSPLNEITNSDISNLQFYTNYDFSILNLKSSGGINDFSISLSDGTNSVKLIQTSDLKGFFKIPNDIISNLQTNFTTESLDLVIDFTDVSANTIIPKNTSLPFYFNVLRMGYVDSETQPTKFFAEYYAIPELTETGIDTGIFTGQVEFFGIGTKQWSTYDFSSLETRGSNLKIPASLGQDIEIDYVDGQDASLELIEVGDSAGTGIDFFPKIENPIVVETLEETKYVEDLSDYVFSPSLFETNIYGLGEYTMNQGTFEFTPYKDISGEFSKNVLIGSGTPWASSYTVSIPVIFKIQNTDDPISSTDLELQSVEITEDTKIEIPIVNLCAIGIKWSDECVSPKNNNKINEINVINHDNDKLTFSVISSPDFLQISGTNSLIITPQKNFAGTDEAIIKLSDGVSETGEIKISFTIKPVNDIPIAKAGDDQSVNINSIVQLDGTQSSDVDSELLTYSWIQTSGYPVTLSDNTITNPQFTSPSDSGQLTFLLTVSDGYATSVPDIIHVYVGEPVPEPTPPPTPQLSSSSTSLNTSLLWNVEDDGGSPITNYVVEFKKSDSTQWEIYEQLDDSTSLGLTGLEFNQSYDFRVYAKNIIGDSEVSEIISITLKEKKVNVEPELTIEPEPTPVSESIQNKISQIKEKVSEIKKLLEILRSLQ